jgi:hypothetical protein
MLDVLLDEFDTGYCKKARNKKARKMKVVPSSWAFSPIALRKRLCELDGGS